MGVYDLVNDNGFLAAFYDRLHQYQVSNIKKTHEDVFYELDDEFFEAFKQHRFKNYDCFRMWKYKKLKNL